MCISVRIESNRKGIVIFAIGKQVTIQAAVRLAIASCKSICMYAYNNRPFPAQHTCM
jgi:hypothetical protein